VSERLLTRQQVCSQLSVSKSTLDTMRQEDSRFPKPLLLRGRTLRWSASSIEKYIRTLPELRTPTLEGVSR